MDWGVEELFERLQLCDECQKIEVKEAKNKIGSSILETISAFSNEPGFGGGYILLGLKKCYEQENGNRYLLQGVENPDELQQQLAGICRESFNAPIRPEIRVEPFQGKVVIVAYIPECNHCDKPVYIRKLGLERGCFRRIGSADFLCTSKDLELLFQLRNGVDFESEILPHTVWEDIDVEAVKEYRRIRKEIEPEAAELSLTDKDLLISLGCAIRKSEEILPNVAGIVLFGTKAALRRLLPIDSRVDYIMTEGSVWIEKPSVRYHTIEYREPLIFLMPRLHSQVMSDIPTRFSLKEDGVQREDIPSIPREVIREAISNALMHRDYHTGQPTQIIRYSNRLEFRNAGYSLKVFDELNEPGSKQRNVIISSVFHELKFAEIKGTGLRIIRQRMKEAGLSTPPIIETDRERNEFDLILLPHHLLDKEALEWLSQFKKYNLSDAQCRALVFAKEIGAITNQDYRQLNAADTLSASAALRGLRDLDLLSKKGRGNGTYYILEDKALSSEDMALSSEDKALSSEDKALSSEDMSDDSLWQGIPKDLQLMIQSTTKRSMSEDTIREIIIQLCSIRSFTSFELSKLLGRHQKHIRQHYLNDLIRKGELEYTHPDQANHPKQSYRRPL